MSDFLNTNYSFKLDKTFDCGCVSDIKPALLTSNNYNPNNNNRIPIFSPGSNVFNTYGKLWCLNGEYQDRCEPDKDYILVPKNDVSPNDIVNDINNLNYSNNILNNLIENDIYLNKAKKFDSTGININTNNSYTTIDTSNNPYPFNVNFTPDNISLQKLNDMNMEKVKACNNRSIENRFRPVYLHIPEEFLEICEPTDYESRNNASKFK
tara:strand:+ start:4537 stop:5163 length:627 start_codon:yes stop_codon:yes gene_type:complete